MLAGHSVARTSAGLAEEPAPRGARPPSHREAGSCLKAPKTRLSIEQVDRGHAPRHPSRPRPAARAAVWRPSQHQCPGGHDVGGRSGNCDQKWASRGRSGMRRAAHPADRQQRGIRSCHPGRPGGEDVAEFVGRRAPGKQRHEEQAGLNAARYRPEVAGNPGLQAKNDANVIWMRTAVPGDPADVYGPPIDRPRLLVGALCLHSHVSSHARRRQPADLGVVAGSGAAGPVERGCVIAAREA